MLQTTCCDKTLSRVKEDARYAWFKCWICRSIFRVRLFMTPGEY